MADVKITVDYSELTGLVKTSGQTKQALSLMAKEFAKTGDVTRFKNGVNALARAQVNLKSSSQKTYFELLELGNQMKQQTVFAERLGAAYESSAASAQVFGKRANRTGVLAQQAGYQFGDFAVQVQSGTNVMVAFGQQATQLIGTMSMLATSTKAILAFSALGVIVPVGTALAAAFMRSAEASDEAAKGAKNFEDSLKNARSEVGSMEQSLRVLREGFVGVFELTLSDNLITEVAKLEALKEELSLAEQDFATRRSRGGRSDIVASRERVEAQEEVVRLAREELQTAQDTATEYDQLKDIREILKRAAEKTAEREEAAREARQRSLEITYQQEQLIQNEVDLMRVQAEFGKDSAEYKAEQNKIALETFRTELQRLGLGPAMIDALVEQMSAARELANELERAEAADLRRSKISFQNNSMDEAMQAILYQQYGTSRSLAPEEPPEERTRRSSRGSGGSRRTEIDYLKRLEEEAEFKRNLIGLSEQETFSLERRRQITELLTRNNRTLTDTDQERISAIIATEEQTRALIAEEERRTQAIDLVKNNMENAFMEMVQGSKSVEDAFRAMLFNIISELYRQAVVKTFVNAFTGFLGFKDGGAFSNGTQVKAFANGGVVDGPTTFPMSGGRTGLMGEAGPEAIMPLKRGSDGKLGVHVKGGNTQEAPIVINQSFNFQASGDESVKKLIAQSAPKIADMAKNSVLEARRRGGKMRSTFG